MEPKNNELVENEERNASAPTEPVLEGQSSSLSTRPIGPTVGITLVVVLLILGALYFFWYGKQDNRQYSPSAEEIINADDPLTSELQSQSDSDEISSIEQDLNTTQFDDLDADAANIDTELSF
ncbi:MAG TPA: SKG-like transmembrane protein [Candidatus Paceibacterota bacterium]